MAPYSRMAHSKNKRQIMEFVHVVTSLLQREAVMEFVRLGVVYTHLIACCVAIGLVLTSDFAMIKQLLKGSDSIHLEQAPMETLKRTITLALQMLWFSGVLIVLLDMSAKGLEYLLNPKLQAKVLIVALLTVNGSLLHSVIMPALMRAGSLLQLEPGMRALSIFAGTVSAVSWFYAALLGVGRPLAWKYSLGELLYAYPMLIFAGFIAMSRLVKWARKRQAHPMPQQAPNARESGPALDESRGY